MQLKELKTPFGKINMYKNGQKISFEVERSSYGMYLDDNTLKTPQGLYLLYPNISELKKGDSLCCEFDGGDLQDDGGDEFMMNMVGVHQGYTIGMGVPDSQDIEDRYMMPGRRVLPYETWGSTKKGFEIHIVDDPSKDSYSKAFQKLYFIVAWEPGTTDKTWELISYVTC